MNTPTETDTEPFEIDALKIVMRPDPEHHGQPRRWIGVTNAGVRCFVYVSKIAFPDLSEELQPKGLQ